MRKRIIGLILMIAVFMTSLSAMAAQVGGVSISSQGACVMDYETGEVLYEHNGNKARVPASMTKIMNLYCIYEALANGEIALDTEVPISKNVYDKSRNSVYQSVLPLYYNTKYTVDEMMGVIVTYSASGAAIAMAELIGGSEAAYVERMNAKASEMGIDAYYYDSCGIADNQITPIGMAKLARNIIKDYPDILTRSAKPYVMFHGNRYKTTNHLLDTYYYEGADGLKTGTTPAAGYCFCGTAVRNGNRVISVTMSSSSTGQRFVDTAALLDYGFAVLNARYNSVYFTDVSTYINGAQIPTFMYKGANEHAAIIAEDLKDYGFDVVWDAENDTVRVSYNKEKAASPIAIDSYKGKNGEKAANIDRSSKRKVIINDGVKDYEIEDVYAADGYTYISIDELKQIYAFEWKQDEKAAYVTVAEKAPKAILPNGEELTSGSAYILDCDTGEELYAFDADTQKPCASIAKMMSIYVILDAIKNGEISLDTEVPISENVYKLSRVEDYKMMVNLEYTEKYTVDEMMDMIVIYSAAPCVTAVAELICGSEAEFVKRMNAKAKEIGIGSVFYNGTGVCLNPETDKENMMSAKEIAIMAKHMIADYPEVLERTKRASVDFHGQSYYNMNKLFTDYYYEGADGFKNGMTPVAGYCMCASAIRDGRRLVTVTLPSNSNEARFTDSIKMLDYGYGKIGVDTSKKSEASEEKLDESMEVTVNIDGNYIVPFADQKPVIINNRIHLPVRQIMETLEKKVEWIGESGEIRIYDDTTTLTLKVGEKSMKKELVNPLDGTKTSETVELDAAPVVINDRTCVPIRAIAEAFGMAVIWESETQTVLIIAGVC